MSGPFITFEGGEGGGKSTQIGLLREYLKSEGHEIVVTREPGGTPIAERIRTLLLDPENTALTPLAELMLYEAARAQHVGELIAPALEAGKIVLCDRFCDSTVAYQGAGRSLSGESVYALNELATHGLMPDITLLMDLPPETGLNRAKGDAQGDRIEKESIDFHTRVREGFLLLAENHPERIHTIDALKSVEEISITIRDIIASALASKEG
jgi:dTMP kinase